MRLARRQASDDTAHSQRSAALGIHGEFWVMRSDVPQLSGLLTGCSDQAVELVGSACVCGGVGVGRVTAAAFLEAAYVGLSSD